MSGSLVDRDLSRNHLVTSSAIKISLAPGEQLVVKSRTVIATIEDRDTLPLIGSTKQRQRITIFNRGSTACECVLAPSEPGIVKKLALQAETWLLRPQAYFASSSGIRLRRCWAGVRAGLFGHGFFHLLAEGTGDLYIAAHGGIYDARERAPRPRVEESLAAHPKMLRGHLSKIILVSPAAVLAYNAALHVRWRFVGHGLLGLGLLQAYEGHGRLLLETRSLARFRSWLGPRIK